jgi:hypothetical protein
MSRSSADTAAEQANTNELTGAEFHQLPSKRRRLAAVEVHGKRSPPGSTADLATARAAHDETGPTVNTPDADRLAVKLHHVDLPLMADLGLLDYDAERSAIEAIRVPADLVGR